MKKEIRKVMIATFLLWFSVYTYPSFLQTYAQDVLGASAVMIGIITGSYGFTQMLLRIPFGIWSDMIHKRKPFVVLGMVASAVSALGFLFVRSAFGALLCRSIAGIAVSSWVNYTVLYSAYFKPEEINGAISRLSLPQYISQVFAMLLGPFLAERFGEAWAFALAAVAAVLGIVITLSIKDLTADKAGNAVHLKDLVGVVRNRSLLVSTALSTIFHFVCWGTVLGFVANWAKDMAHFTTTQLGFLSVAYMLPNTLISRLSGGVFAQKFGEKKVSVAGFLMVAVACFLYSLADNAVLLFALQVVFGMGMGLVLPLTMSGAIKDIETEKRGAAMGFYQSVYGLGMFIGPVLAGALVQGGGYVLNFCVMGIIAILGAVVAFLCIQEKGK